MTIPRRIRVIGVLAALLLGAAGTLWAHATLVRSSPAGNERLSSPPRWVRLEFSEAVTARTSRVELVAPDSQRFTLQPRNDSVDAKVLVADVPRLPVAGTYRVEWRLVGPDGHAVTGRYAFTLDSIPAPPLPDTTRAIPAPPSPDAVHEPPADSWLQRTVRFLSLLSTVVVIGAIMFALFILPAATRSGSEASAAFQLRSERSLRSLALVGAWSLAILAVLRLTSHAVLLSGSLGSLRTGDLADLLFGSTFGRGWMLQVAALTALLLWLRPQSPRWSPLLYACGALAISASFLGHPAAVPDVPMLAMGFDAIHVLAAGGWAGAIVMLALAALPQLRFVPPTDRLRVARDLLRGFSPLALTCAAILALTGAVSGWLQLREVGLVFGSDYGLMLVRKVIVVLFIAAVGAYHWKVVQPAVDNERSISRFRMSLALDVALVLLVLVFTTLLTGTAPPVR